VSKRNARPNSQSTSSSLLPAPRVRALLRRRLLAWFDRHRRDLPWRQDRDAYRIWVSEVMLQQTHAAVVIPYFERFVQAFPTFSDLAAADPQTVLLLWEGLGYYRRARDLHAAAQQLVAKHAGRVPNDPDLLAGLPGLGRYTRNAILSQAYDRRLPILEANSQRVLSRLYGYPEDPRQGPARARLWERAEELLPVRRAGDFNQAVMELGAVLCTSAAPRCPACPLAQFCLARQLGIQDKIPPPSRPVRVVAVNETAVVVWRKKTVLLVQRPATGRWAGMWEFPHGVKDASETFARAGIRHVRELTGVRAALGAEVMTVRHGITRYRITLACFEARYTSGRYHSAFYQQGRWVTPNQLALFPISAPQRRLAKILAGEVRQRVLFRA
jgi:A/G-specific adenine glycosylase